MLACGPRLLRPRRVHLSAAGSPFCLRASHAAWSGLRCCWSDALFLPALAHRLWRLTLQILARFAVFVHEVRPAARAPLCAQLPSAAPSAGARFTRAVTARGQHSVASGSPTPTRSVRRLQVKMKILMKMTRSKNVCVLIVSIWKVKSHAVVEVKG